MMRLEWSRLPNGRVHLVLSDAYHVPVLCGWIDREWMTNVVDHDHRVTLILTPVVGGLPCEHGAS
jgi:hypothetical protein